MRFEFQDINRFLVSCGIVLIALAALMPWLFLREPLEVIFSISEYEGLEEKSRALVDKKQITVGLALASIPYISAILLFFGIASIIEGIRRWLKNQKRLDEKDEILVDIERIKLEKMTENEVNEKISYEVKEALGENTTEIQREIFAKSYQEIEAVLSAKIEIAYKNLYNVRKNVKFEKYYYDIILNPKKLDQRSKVIEIRLRRDDAGGVSIRALFLMILSAARKYISTNDQPADAVLIIVYSDDEWKNSDPLNSMALAEELPNNTERNNKICGFSVSEVAQFRSEQIAERIDI